MSTRCSNAVDLTIKTDNAGIATTTVGLTPNGTITLTDQTFVAAKVLISTQAAWFREVIKTCMVPARRMRGRRAVTNGLAVGWDCIQRRFQSTERRLEVLGFIDGNTTIHNQVAENIDLKVLQ